MLGQKLATRSITGWFEGIAPVPTDPTEAGPTAEVEKLHFNGRLQIGPGHCISGEVSDAFGKAKITGLMNEQGIIFEKQYEPIDEFGSVHSDSVCYVLERQPDGSFEGSTPNLPAALSHLSCRFDD